MKKFIITMITAMMAIVSYEAKAQGLVYTPFIPQESSSSSSMSVPNYSQRHRSYGGSRATVQTQRARSTAYCWHGGDRYGKLPIVLEYSQSGIRIVQVYYASQSLVYGASEGRWVDIYPVSIQQCYPDLSNHPLEKSFMYKASINGTTYYFDL